MNRLESALSAVLDALSREGLHGALVGGLAVSARAEPRFTRDIDVAIDSDSDSDTEQLVGRLLGRGYRMLSQIEQKSTGRLATVRLVPRDEPSEGVVVDLLFASSGIEPEIVNQADRLRISAVLEAPVARLGHLLALKLLLRNNQSRPQDSADIASLLREATSDELTICREAINLVETRGYACDKQLLNDLDTFLTG